MASSRELRDRLAVVTGGTRGIGRATAVLLSQAGARVLVVARTAEAARETAAALSGVPVIADVATETGVTRVHEAVRTLGVAAPDIVVHAAGSFRLAPLAETTIAAFDEMLAVNLRAAFLLARAFLPAMLERRSGHLVTIGSVAGRRGFAANGAYSASKFGVRGLHAVLATELRGTGVRATFVEPAATDTPLWDEIDRAGHADLPERAAMLDPGAVAEAVLYALTQPDAVSVSNILLERA